MVMNRTAINEKDVILTNRLYAQLSPKAASLVLVCKTHFILSKSQLAECETSRYGRTEIFKTLLLLMSIQIRKKKKVLTIERYKTSIYGQ